MFLSLGYDIFFIANQITVFGTGCSARPKGRSGLMFDCHNWKQKPQAKGENGHFQELSRSKLAQASIWLAWAMGKLQLEATSLLGRAPTY